MVKVKQIRVSRNVKFFADRMMQKYSLVPYTDQSEPLVMYGIYNEDDYKVYQDHKAPMIILWRGTDAKILTEKKAQIILSRSDCRHYAGSRIVKQSLEKWGIHPEIKPISPTPILKPVPRGNSVYCYICSRNPLMSTKYKYDLLKRIADKLPYKFIFTEQKNHTFERLQEVYRQCFVGVRLLDHDGMSNTILEMGMMGRRTISNSGLPHAISWKGIKDIQVSINREYKNRKRPDWKIIGKDYQNLINIGDSWLEL